MNWYAVFVRTGKEDEVCDNLKKLYEFFSPKDQYEVIVPKRGLYEYHEGRKDYVLRTLFPSYVLIGTNQIIKLYEIMKNHKSIHIIKLLKNDNFFQEINEREIDSIINLINKEGVIGISDIYVEDEKVNIIDGPLSHYNGIIKKINRRKGRAKIQVDFLNKKCFVDIAIRCLEKYKEDNVKNQITFS
jgi:transcriptional antiterminator NusG